MQRCLCLAISERDLVVMQKSPHKAARWLWGDRTTLAENAVTNTQFTALGFERQRLKQAMLDCKFTSRLYHACLINTDTELVGEDRVVEEEGEEDGVGEDAAEDAEEGFHSAGLVWVLREKTKHG